MEDAIKRAIAAADSAGTASGFEHGVTQVIERLRAQAQAWRREHPKRWFRPWIPRRVLAAATALEAVADQLEKSVREQHAPEAAKRRAEATELASAAIAAVAPVTAPTGILRRARLALGGAARRTASG